jgi:methionine synthase I (cobalamin-dependent)
MGTLLYAKGIFINRSYDELNLSQPDLIRGIHHEYLQAGAEIIETNTFGANSFRLARHSLADKVRDVNLAGVQLAREAAKSFDVGRRIGWPAGNQNRTPRQNLIRGSPRVVSQAN